MDEIIVYSLLGLLAVIFGLSFYFSYRKKVKIMARITDEYGSAPIWSQDERDYASMKQYYESVPPSEGEIDDITWNDLNMDLIFKRFKNTQSSIGDEYVYRFFRSQKNPEIEHFEETVQAVDHLSKERKRLQYAFHRIGRKTGNQLVSFLHSPENFPKIPMVAITLMTLIGILSIIWMAVDIDYGLLAVVLSFSASIILYSFAIRKIYRAMEILGMFSSMLKAAKLFAKLDIPEFRQETKKVRENLKHFSAITSMMDFIIQSAMGANSMLLILVSYFGLYGFAYALLVRQFCRHRKEALEIYEAIGFIELCISTASYRESLEYYCNPTFTDETTVKLEELVHPLLRHPVANSHEIGNKILITGSNASGKSTFARTLAVNVIMGQLINTCLAKRFTFRPCEVYTSMNLKDDISTGDSFYVAEVKSLKRLLDVAAGPRYSMLFMDEIFKGTNMVERIAAASVILERFANSECFICLTTHDVELCRIMGELYENYHFVEVIDSHEIFFDYTLHDGVTTGSNAIKLLAHCDYDAEIISQAQSAAEHYRSTGEWDTY